MKIVHCCFGIEHYIDTWGYQQNLLPLYCAKMGHETVVLASNDTFPSFLNPDLICEIKNKGHSYYNGLVRIERGNSYFHSNIHFQIARQLQSILSKEAPDVIFFHGSLNLSLYFCVSYKKKNPKVRLFVDNHGDVFNVHPNKLYRFLYFKVFLSLFHHICQKYVDCYFGVTNGRCSFLSDYLHISEDRIKLLPIGADVDAVGEIKESREELRSRYGFGLDDVIIIHGGKLDTRKGTIDLIEAYRETKKTYPHLRLILFGKMVDPRIKPMLDKDIVVYDWMSRTQTFELLKLADLAVWPIHHTTLIEDCVASGLPYLIRKTETTQHLINSDFYLVDGNKGELYHKILAFIQNLSTANNIYMENVAKIRDAINYYTIAQQITTLSKQT